MSYVDLVVERLEDQTGIDPRRRPDGRFDLDDVRGEDITEKMGHMIEGTWNAVIALASALDERSRPS